MVDRDRQVCLHWINLCTGHKCILNTIEFYSRESWMECVKLFKAMGAVAFQTTSATLEKELRKDVATVRQLGLILLRMKDMGYDQEPGSRKKPSFYALSHDASLSLHGLYNAQPLLRPYECAHRKLRREFARVVWTQKRDLATLPQSQLINLQHSRLNALRPHLLGSKRIVDTLPSFKGLNLPLTRENPPSGSSLVLREKETNLTEVLHAGERKMTHESNTFFHRALVNGIPLTQTIRIAPEATTQDKESNSPPHNTEP